MTEANALPDDFPYTYMRFPGMTEDEQLACKRYENAIAGAPDCFDLGSVGSAGVFDDDRRLGPAVADYADLARAHLEIYEQWRSALFDLRGAFWGMRVSDAYVLYGRCQMDELGRAADALGSYAVEALCGKPMSSPEVQA